MMILYDLSPVVSIAHLLLYFPECFSYHNPGVFILYSLNNKMYAVPILPQSTLSTVSQWWHCADLQPDLKELILLWRWLILISKCNIFWWMLWRNVKLPEPHTGTECEHSWRSDGWAETWRNKGSGLGCVWRELGREGERRASTQQRNTNHWEISLQITVGNSTCLIPGHERENGERWRPGTGQLQKAHVLC